VGKKRKANKKHKSGAFATLFSKLEAIRELYRALTGVTLPASAEITIATLANVLYMGIMNDLAFFVNGRLVVLVEHQSTVNENMPLRLLFYAVQVYNNITDSKSHYRKKAIKIPAPVFIVLYNGKEEYPDHKELLLSDLYEDVADLLPWETALPALELKVQVYNINNGRNPEIMARSKLLREYSIFIGKIREFEQKLPLKEAIDAAVKYCMENDVLEEFLETHGKEVKNMLMTEFNQIEAMAVSREEGIAIGEERGIAIGEERGIAIGAAIGEERGRAEGIAKAAENAARKALAKGLPLEVISEITGLDIETINGFCEVDTAT